LCSHSHGLTLEIRRSPRELKHNVRVKPRIVCGIIKEQDCGWGYKKDRARFCARGGAWCVLDLDGNSFCSCRVVCGVVPVVCLCVWPVCVCGLFLFLLTVRAGAQSPRQPRIVWGEIKRTGCGFTSGEVVVCARFH